MNIKKTWTQSTEGDFSFDLYILLIFLQRTWPTLNKSIILKGKQMNKNGHFHYMFLLTMIFFHSYIPWAMESFPHPTSTKARSIPFVSKGRIKAFIWGNFINILTKCYFPILEAQCWSPSRWSCVFYITLYSAFLLCSLPSAFSLKSLRGQD